MRTVKNVIIQSYIKTTLVNRGVNSEEHLDISRISVEIPGPITINADTIDAAHVIGLPTRITRGEIQPEAT
jgi:hypothetical protein